MTIKSEAQIAADKAAGCNITWMKAKEIERHPEGYAGWARDEEARLAKARANRDKMVAAVLKGAKARKIIR